MGGPQVPFPRARLSERVAANCALERLQVDVSLVVDDQTRALRECLVADGAVRVEEPAPEMRRVGVLALNGDLDFLESAAGKHL